MRSSLQGQHCATSKQPTFQRPHCGEEQPSPTLQVTCEWHPTLDGAACTWHPGSWLGSFSPPCPCSCLSLHSLTCTERARKCRDLLPPSSATTWVTNTLSFWENALQCPEICGGGTSTGTLGPTGKRGTGSITEASPEEAHLLCLSFRTRGLLHREHPHRPVHGTAVRQVLF